MNSIACFGGDPYIADPYWSRPPTLQHHGPDIVRLPAYCQLPLPHYPVRADLHESNQFQAKGLDTVNDWRLIWSSCTSAVRARHYRVNPL
ncbi:hypothetical protein N9444_01630 [Gammaproteobacteria bacterium]|nr:hypothetical protein [Gammaproteobacteria bacterium]